MSESTLKTNCAAIALVDCNNFYVSSESAFNPKLCNKPVVFISNNDGCVISRSNEAKEFIPMGAPLFRYEKILEEREAEVFSSNQELQGDIFDRVTNSFFDFAPEAEIYSIDEAFFKMAEGDHKPNSGF